MAHSNMVCDAHLSTLCWRSRVAFRQWTAAGSPRSGPLYDERKTCKKNVRVYLSHCQAQLQRKAILIKLFVLTTLNVFKRPFRNLVEPLSSSMDPPPLTLPLFYPYGLTISHTSAFLTSLPIPPFRESRTPSQK